MAKILGKEREGGDGEREGEWERQGEIKWYIVLFYTLSFSYFVNGYTCCFRSWRTSSGMLNRKLKKER